MSVEQIGRTMLPCRHVSAFRTRRVQQSLTAWHANASLSHSSLLISFAGMICLGEGDYSPYGTCHQAVFGDANYYCDPDAIGVPAFLISEVDSCC